MRQMPLPIGPVPRPGYDNFLPGPNAAALAHVRALGGPSAPLYLWGPGGTGKSHLLHALAAQRRQQGCGVAWVDAATEPPGLPPADWSLLVFDDCDRYHAAQQQAAFALFVEAASLGVQIAAAGRLPPVDLPLREDLRTRLAWGHVFALQPLGDPDARLVLRREAEGRGMALAEEVLDHLLTHAQRDLGHLMRLVDRLDRFGLAESRRITVPLLRQMLAEQVEARNPAVDPVPAA